MTFAISQKAINYVVDYCDLNFTKPLALAKFNVGYCNMHVIATWISNMHSARFDFLLTSIASVVEFSDCSSRALITKLSTWLVVFREEGSNETMFGLVMAASCMVRLAACSTSSWLEILVTYNKHTCNFSELDTSQKDL